MLYVSRLAISLSKIKAIKKIFYCLDFSELTYFIHVLWNSTVVNWEYIYYWCLCMSVHSVETVRVCSVMYMGYTQIPPIANWSGELTFEGIAA